MTKEKTMVEKKIKETAAMAATRRLERSRGVLVHPADLLGATYDEADKLYAIYEVGIKFRDRCLGGRPKLIDVAMAALEAKARAGKMPEDVLERAKADMREAYTYAEKARENGDVSDEAYELDGAKDSMSQAWNGFYYDGVGIYLEQRVIKACLKSCFTQLGIFKTKKVGPGGTVGAKQTHNTGFFVCPGRVYFERDGEILKRPDGYEDMPAHVTDQKTGAPRSILSRIDYVTEAEMTFIAKPLIGGAIDEHDLLRALALSRDVGLGAKRSQSFGQFELTKVQRLGIGR